jgi:hypothetical protein
MDCGKRMRSEGQEGDPLAQNLARGDHPPCPYDLESIQRCFITIRFIASSKPCIVECQKQHFL